MNVFKIISKLTLALMLSLIMVSCADDNDGTTQSEIRLEITDAPIDDANVKGAFVTVADVQIDGKSFAGFQGKQTIDLLAYQNGDTKLLGEGMIEAESFSQISLIIDYEEDENGNSPGCYLLDQDNNKENLSAGVSGQQSINISNSGSTVESGSKQTIILDFDLRKAIRRNANNDEDYEMVAQSQLQTAVRANVSAQTGIIRGNCQNAYNFADKVVVYAYQEGSFNKATEVQGSGGIQFQNAANSAVVSSDGTYQLHFLKEGKYELFFAAYQESNDNEGQFELAGSLALDIAGTLNLGVAEVNSNSSTELNILVTGLIPL
jgi:hypothetical protein